MAGINVADKDRPWERCLSKLLIGLAVLLVMGCGVEQTASPTANSQPSDDRPGLATQNQERMPVDSEQEAPAGIGAALRIEGENVFVAKVFPETSAAQSNALKQDDQIIAVAEGNEAPVNVTGLRMNKVVGMIRGSKGTVVRLTIVPAGKEESELQVVSLTRGYVKGLDLFGDGKLIPVGTKAPNINFTRLVDGEDADLSQYAGKIVVLDLWATWCGPCIELLDKLQNLPAEHPEWEGQVVLLAVSADERMEDATKLFTEKQWKGISVVWAGPEVLKTYHANSLPSMYVIDQNGDVAASHYRFDVLKVVEPLLQHPG